MNGWINSTDVFIDQLFSSHENKNMKKIEKKKMK